ncbi:MAG: serine/threonine-protein kinase [Planctomycetota bacterium]
MGREGAQRSLPRARDARHRRTGARARHTWSRTRAGTPEARRGTLTAGGVEVSNPAFRGIRRASWLRPLPSAAAARWWNASPGRVWGRLHGMPRAFDRTLLDRSRRERPSFHGSGRQVPSVRVTMRQENPSSGGSGARSRGAEDAPEPASTSGSRQSTSGACPRASADQLWGLIDEPSSAGAELHDHVARCPLCRESLGTIRRLHEGLQSIAKSSESPPPDRIGEYRIVRTLGSGGMGIVYEARQISTARRVALKVMQPAGATSRARLTAFRREIAALGRLGHASIAGVHDAGVTERGQLYLVMDLVDGERLDRYCEARGTALPLRARVALLAHIADAVHHAHQRGVIHRDLKPANVLVDAEGRPHVLDFGLARFLDPVDDVTLTHTLARLEPAGTLPYMSPEALRGDDASLDVRTDVYALGVLLYQLLTGRLPYGRPTTASAALQAFAGTPAQHPSKVDARIPRELGDVVLKAVAIVPDARYGSAAALADDLGRFLAGEAVAARPAGYGYRVRVFVRLHKALVAAVLVSFAAVLAGAGLAWNGLVEARRQRDEMGRMTGILTGVLGRADPGRAGAPLTVRDIFERIATPLEGAAAVFDRPSLAEAELRMLVGVGLRDVQELERSLPHLRRAIDLSQRILGPAHPKTVAARLALGTALFALLTPRGGWNAAVDPAVPEEARAVLGENVARFEAGEVPLTVDVVGSLRTLAFLGPVDRAKPLAGAGWVLTGEISLARALALVRTLPESDARASEEGWLLTELGGFPNGVEELDTCVERGRAGLAMRESLALRQTGAVRTWDVDQAVCFLSSTVAKRALSLAPEETDADEAIALARRACELARSPWIGSHWGDRGYRCMALGTKLLVTRHEPRLAAGAFEEALAALHDADVDLRRPHRRLEILAHLVRAWHAAAEPQREREASQAFAAELAALADDPARRADALWDLAIAARQDQCPADEVRLIGEHVVACAEAAGRTGGRAPEAELRWVECLERVGRLADAAARCHELLTRLDGEFGPEAPAVIRARVALASARAWLGDRVEPSELAHLAQLATDHAKDEPVVIEALRVEGLVRADLGDLAQAEDRLRRAVALGRGWQKKGAEQFALAEWALARVLGTRGARAEGRRWLEDAYARARVAFGDGYWQAALVRCEMARWLVASDPERAATIAAEAFPVLCAALGDGHRFVVEFRSCLRADDAGPTERAASSSNR